MLWKILFLNDCTYSYTFLFSTGYLNGHIPQMKKDIDQKCKQRKELESWTKSSAYGSETEATFKQDSFVEDEASKQQEQVSKLKS